ncbi:ankyrin repeat domain-containing protein [Legionella sp. 27cVA30]|uniref:ankyrin repeat domain-containing protein n=1 Tax=Legionella sp. 27cVA30 TaxID=2905657 RepID=UPI00209CC494|nr:ankyrin repeat domain-containing protein [Legionella sp. 27cVA30]MCP0914266.1 ankyrin repeat domain-containing protein [Legionella sp. 27cVA30]
MSYTMLNELFSWLNDDANHHPISSQIVYLSTLKNELDGFSLKNRKLLASFWSSKYSSNDNVNAEAQKKLSMQKEFLDFLNFCENKLAVKDGCSAALLAFQYAIASQQQVKRAYDIEKMKQLISLAMQENREETLSYYLSEKEHLNSDVRSAISTAIVEHNLSYFTVQFTHQKNPLGIIPLCRQFLGTPEEFAALLLWLLQQGVAVERILKAGLLHDFIGYHLFSLHAPESPIIELYALMAQFPQAHALCEKAARISCSARGLEAYTLTGVLQEAEESCEIDREDSYDFTSDADNFKDLYTVFAQPFLSAALKFTAQEAWFEQLAAALNSLPLKDLSRFIDMTAAEKNPKLIEKLSALISVGTLNGLLDDKHWSVLHLLPYKGDLYEKISSIKIEGVLNYLDQQEASLFDKIPQLMSLFLAFRDKKKEVAISIYENIIDKIADNPQFSEDSYLLKNLRKFKHKERILVKKCGQYEASFHFEVLKQIACFPFTISHYYAIEDAWLHASRKLNALKEIVYFDSGFPHDKYNLQGYIGKLLFKQQGEQFNIEDFMVSLGVDCILNPTEVNEYEYALIESLCAIDEENCRNKIIGMLAEKYKNYNWLHRKYGQEGILARVLRNDNAGLFIFLAEKQPLQITRALIKEICREAVHFIPWEITPWNVIHYLVTTNAEQFDCDVIRQFLDLAIQQNRPASIELFCKLGIQHQDKKLGRMIERAFRLAVEQANIPLINFFCGLNQSLISPTLMLEGVGQALTKENFAIAAYIMESIPKNNFFQHSIEMLLQAAVAKNKPNIIQFLYGATETLSKNCLQKAFLKAVNLGFTDSVRQLCNLPTALPVSILDAGLESAIKLGHLHVVEYLCTVKLAKGKEYLTQKTLDIALQVAARHGVLMVVDYLCNLDLQPSQAALRSAYKRAVSKEHTAVALYLRNREKATRQVTLETPSIGEEAMGLLPSMSMFAQKTLKEKNSEQLIGAKSLLS